MSLRIIEGIKKVKTDFPGIYFRIYFDCIREASNGTDEIDKLEISQLRKIIFFGVKMINTLDRTQKNSKRCEAVYSLSYAIKNLMSHVTPNDLEIIFPITKDYDGDKYGIKDYFFTKKAMRAMGENVLIGDKIDDLLWDYQNWDVREFMVNFMSIVDDVRRLKGEQGIIEKFFEEKGLPTYTLYEDEKGQKHLKNNKTEEVIKVKNPKPRYLNLVQEKSPIPDQEN